MQITLQGATLFATAKTENFIDAHYTTTMTNGATEVFKELKFTSYLVKEQNLGYHKNLVSRTLNVSSVIYSVKSSLK